NVYKDIKALIVSREPPLAAEPSSSLFYRGPFRACLGWEATNGGARDEAVREGLAARGEKMPRRLHPPWGSGWRRAGDKPPGEARAQVFVREIWPPGLGPPGDDVFDIV